MEVVAYKLGGSEDRGRSRYGGGGGETTGAGDHGDKVNHYAVDYSAPGRYMIGATIENGTNVI